MLETSPPRMRIRRWIVPLIALLAAPGLGGCIVLEMGAGAMDQAAQAARSDERNGTDDGDGGTGSRNEDWTSEAGRGQTSNSDTAAENRLDGQAAVEATVAAFRSAQPLPTVIPPSPVPTRTPVPPTPTPTQTTVPSPTAPPSPTIDPFTLAGVPTRLEVPSLGIDTYIEQVGLTPDRAMDVPKEWQNVGWYDKGYRPGEQGNAVIAGHLDTTSGGPAVFWDLDQLLPGDEVNVTYSNGDRYTFIVQESGEYSYNAEGEVIDLIFGDSPTNDLNLITCQGNWDRSNSTYDKRLVVFTSLVPELTVRVNVEDDGIYD